MLLTIILQFSSSFYQFSTFQILTIFSFSPHALLSIERSSFNRSWTLSLSTIATLSALNCPALFSPPKTTVVLLLAHKQLRSNYDRCTTVLVDTARDHPAMAIIYRTSYPRLPWTLSFSLSLFACNRRSPLVLTRLVAISPENHPNNQLFCSFHLLSSVLHQLLFIKTLKKNTDRNTRTRSAVWTRGKEISIKRDMRHRICCRIELICRPSTIRPHCICSGSPKRTRPSTGVGSILRRPAHVILWSS